jgi:hypothetical protein
MGAAQFSYWGATIVAAAELSGCRWLLKILQDGRSYESVTVRF